jgi:hypothetical protein
MNPGNLLAAATVRRNRFDDDRDLHFRFPAHEWPRP